MFFTSIYTASISLQLFFVLVHLPLEAAAMGGRKQLPPSDNSELEKKRERDRRRRAASKAGGAAASSSSADNNAMNGKILVLRNELATVLNKPMDEIPLIKCKNGLYDPIDALMIISEKDRQNAAHDLRVICDTYRDVCQKLTHVAFGGQGSRPDSKGCDLPTLVEIMMLSPSQKRAPIRRLAAVTLCRVLGGDTSLANQIFEIRRVQEALRESGQEDHEARVFGRYVEQQQSGATTTTLVLSEDEELRRMSIENRKRQYVMELENIERRAKLRREEDEREAERKREEHKLKKEEQEREAERKREEHKLKKEEQEKKHAAIMQELTLREDKTRQDHASFGITKAEQNAGNKIKVEKMVEAGYISRDEGDRLLGVHRMMLRVSISKILEKIWLGSNITIKNDLPKNYAQIFYEAYSKQKDEFFSSKPSGDFTNDGQQPPQNVKWYDTDLISIWKYAEKLRDDELTKKREGNSLLFCHEPPPHRMCPTMSECRQMFGLVQL
jgi:hypothetical protein